MIIDLTLKNNYSLDIIHEYPSSKRYYYPGATTSGGRDGVMIEVTSAEGKKWVGVFAFGEISSSGITGLFSMPDMNKFCVVSRGAGYIVSSVNPEDWQEVEVIPILDTRIINNKKIIVFADYTEILAYGETGVKWRTERLAYSGFKIIEITEYSLKGEFWNIRNEANDRFEIDLSTGKQIGGVNYI